MAMKFGRLTPHLLATLAMIVISILYMRARPDFAPTPEELERVSP